MSIILVVASFLVIILHQKAPDALRYPYTPTVEAVDTYFDTTIADPIDGLRTIIQIKQRHGLLNRMLLLIAICVVFPTEGKLKRD